VGILLRAPDAKHFTAFERCSGHVQPREFGERLVHCGVGGGCNQNPLSLGQQFSDDIPQRGGLAGTGWAPDKGAITVSAELHCAQLALIQFIVAAGHCFRAPRGRTFAKCQQCIFNMMIG